MNSQLKEIYVDWVNNYLTIEKWAEHNGFTVKEATVIINNLRSAYNREANLLKWCKENRSTYAVPATE